MTPPVPIALPSIEELIAVSSDAKQVMETGVRHRYLADGTIKYEGDVRARCATWQPDAQCLCPPGMS